MRPTLEGAFILQRESADRLSFLRFASDVNPFGAWTWAAMTTVGGAGYVATR
jgi:hypothetical protein